MKPLILTDTNFLCYRAFHTMPELAHNDIGTGAVFGVLRDVVEFQKMFDTPHVAFAFDYEGKGLREEQMPGYKLTRKLRHDEESDEDKLRRANLKSQILEFRRTYLPRLGFNNVFAWRGLEADDIIASIAAAQPPGREVIIISSDQDLWQLITSDVWCYNPITRKAMTEEIFLKEWPVVPSQWADVKAWAGCGTDDVPGIEGIGEITAAKWVAGRLRSHTKAWQKMSEGIETYNRNIGVVRLPFPGTPEFPLAEDNVTEEAWQNLADELGFKTIRGEIPLGARRISKGRKRGKGKKGFGFGG